MKIELALAAGMSMSFDSSVQHDFILTDVGVRQPLNVSIDSHPLHTSFHRFVRQPRATRAENHPRGESLIPTPVTRPTPPDVAQRFIQA
jgi:hypothetical protein